MLQVNEISYEHAYWIIFEGRSLLSPLPPAHHPVLYMYMISFSTTGNLRITMNDKTFQSRKLLFILMLYLVKLFAEVFYTSNRSQKIIKLVQEIVYIPPMFGHLYTVNPIS